MGEIYSWFGGQMDSALWLVLGMGVLHFLWQGLLLGLFAAVTLKFIPATRPSLRYSVGCGFLLTMLLVFISDLVVLHGLNASADFQGSASAASALLVYPGQHFEPVDSLGGIANFTALVWFLGSLGMLLRTLRDWSFLRHLRRRATPVVSTAWNIWFESLKLEYGLPNRVRLLELMDESSKSYGPMVVGWLSPVVIVPASLFTTLPTEQIRLVLRHELAHIRRYDHLVNLVQAAVEILLFFHPAVWWLSKQIRQEREFCCDDSAIHTGSDRRSLAEALFALETVRQNQLSLGAQGGPLMQRIQRILQRDQASKQSTITASRALGFGATTALLLTMGFAQLSFSQGSEPVGPETLFAAQDGERITVETYKKAVERIGQRVREGELSKGAAEKLTIALRGRVSDGDEGKRGEGERTGSARDAKAEYDRVSSELGELVKSGKITREQADDRLMAFRRTLGKESDRDPKAEYDRVSAELDEQVKSGKITREQADDRLSGFKKSHAKDAPMSKLEYKKLTEQIKAAVKAGKLTEEEAEKKCEALDKAFKAITKQQYTEAAKKIEALVKAGEITRAEADKKLAAIRKLVSPGK
ncbi:MAG: beta-lactamase regulating signal transducer with metallopeptidase domain [Planctomycetota bacterium]|jgi:beta-lactamase regulating signal transducer with metallopeptidase domain/polyhydroxyalkanoate synthesis regulator phasin